VSWYAWGKETTADYKNVSTGKTAHRETVKVTYDPMKLDLEEVLDTFFGYIDPYDTWGQFADRGYHYTTAIYYQDEDEKNDILEYINNHDFEDNLATKFVEINSFYEAEEEHQDYAQKKSWNYERYFQGSWRKDYVKENKDKYK
jgi:methionine-S-sulfoxide reductase